MGVDAEKAFGSIIWQFLFRTMKRFNFHESCNETIWTLYARFIARIMVNGSLSNTIKLETGYQQGCLPVFWRY